MSLNLISGWYRVVQPAGNQLSQHKNIKSDSYGSCNTQHGGILIGDHPREPGKIVERKVCFGNDCSTFETKRFLRNIRVINCNQFFLYELETVTNAYAKERYCTETNMEDTDIKKMIKNNFNDLKQDIQANLTDLKSKIENNMDKKSKDFIETIELKLDDTKSQLEQKSAMDIRVLEKKMDTKDMSIKNDVLNDLEVWSKGAIEKVETNITNTKSELKQDIQSLERRLISKDNDIKNDLRRKQKSLAAKINSNITKISNELKWWIKTKHEHLTMDEIPQACKDIVYKNLTDKTRRYNYFNSSGKFCDMEPLPYDIIDIGNTEYESLPSPSLTSSTATSTMDCKQSFDWKYCLVSNKGRA